MRYPRAELGEVLELDLDQVDVDPTATYQMAGIYSFGRGLFVRAPLSGSDTSYKKLTRLSEGQFVYSRLFGWEGAVAVVDRQFDGFFLSHEFPTFRVDPARALPGYLAHIARWPELHERLGANTRGLGLRRKRVHPEQLLAIEIPLPDVEEQRLIASKLDRVLGYVDRIGELQSGASDLVALGPHAVMQSVLDGIDRRVPLGSVAEINPRPSGLVPSEPVSFVPMAALDEVAGVIQHPEPRLAGEVNNGYKQFRKGDVIFARITPSMQNGKSAIADIPTDWGYGSTEFHVIRTTEAVLPAWVHAVVRSPSFRAAAEHRFTGTAGQQRVPAAFMNSVEIPVPPVHEQERLLKELRRLAETGLRLRRLHEMQRSRLDALGPSILNHIFDGNI